MKTTITFARCKSAFSSILIGLALALPAGQSHAAPSVINAPTFVSTQVIFVTVSAPMVATGFMEFGDSTYTNVGLGGDHGTYTWTKTDATHCTCQTLIAGPAGHAGDTVILVFTFKTDYSGTFSGTTYFRGGGTLIDKGTFIFASPLWVTVAGSGSVSGALTTKSNKLVQVPIGKLVTLTATPAKGQTFQGWVGWTNSWDTTIKFAMPSQPVNVTAQFVPAPFSLAAGTYKGLIEAIDPFDSTNSGAFTLTLTASGGFSARLACTSRTNSASGQLGLYQGQTNIVMARFPMTLGGRNVEATFEVVLGTFKQINGTLAINGTSQNVALLEGGLVANTNLGLFNLAVLPTGTNPPSGFGYGSVAISNTGVKINLTLSDNKAVVAGLATSRLQNGFIPVFSSLYGNKGFVSGWLSVSNQQIISTLVWHKAPGASSTYFKAGFNQWVAVRGGAYAAVTNLAPWGITPVLISGFSFTNSFAYYAQGTYSKGALSISVSSDTHSPAPWVITSATGLVKFYQDDGAVYGTGILLPAPAPNPGIYGFALKTNTVHSVFSGPAPAP